VVVKKSLTKTNSISKSNKEPSIKIIPGDTNKPKIISDGKEWNVEELKLRMKKSKELGEKNEGKEYKKEMTKDKASKIITKEIKSRAKLNKADEYLKEKNEIDKIKNYSRNQLEIIIKKIVGYKNDVDYFNNMNNKGETHKLDLNKDTDQDLIKQIKNFKENYKPRTINKEIPKSLFIPEIPEEEKIIPSTQKSRKGRRPIKNYKHAFLKN
jgi:hypothetical protein